MFTELCYVFADKIEKNLFTVCIKTLILFQVTTKKIKISEELQISFEYGLKLEKKTKYLDII